MSKCCSTAATGRGLRWRSRPQVGPKPGGCRGVAGSRQRQYRRPWERIMRQPKRKRTVPEAKPDPADRMRALLEEHLVWMQTQNFSEDTVTTRRSCIGYFLDWCRERSLDDPAEITRPVLERY